ncbi:imm11 family protein [Sphingomicrobium flavum]|uniref:imm11 family protein n=1 Tax=Sphingomicrobium flavum TaxID=1229164 RepID=UPI0021AD8289|nr:DUF1629 domain-containing protein [Sphingomicrobium flavum]
MVWMMSLPNAFGEFFPNGDFEDGDNPDAIGWGGRLEAHINDLPPEQQTELMPSADWFRYGYYVSKKFITEIGKKAAVDLPPITPLLEHEAPRSFHTEKGYKKLGDLITLNDRILAVSEDLKAIIEAHEPYVHQFFPLDIVQPRSVHPKRFFTIVISNYRNSFHDLTGTRPKWSDGRFQFIHMTKHGAVQCGFERSEIDGAHLWYERTLSEFIVLFSDELVSAIQNAGLSTPKIYQAREI